jgi:hypothetical protein
MKKKIISVVFALALLVTAGYGINNSITKASAFSLNLASLEALASLENGNTNDEKDVCMIQACENGKNCECTICEAGSTDCSPTCPCCD